MEKSRYRSHCWAQRPRLNSLSRTSSLMKAVSITGEDIPKSFEESVSQACESIETMITTKERNRGRKSKGIKRLAVEIPALDTGIPIALQIITKLLNALQQGTKKPPGVLLFREEYLTPVREKLPSNPSGMLQEALSGRMSLPSRLLVFSPQQEDEEALFELLDNYWRGDVLALCNAEFSEEFCRKKASFLQSFTTVYCFMPLAIRVFIANKDGALFKWQREKAADAKWQVFLAEKGSFKQIGQTTERPTQEELELTLYNATAADSFLSKGIDFFQSFGKSK